MNLCSYLCICLNVFAVQRSKMGGTEVPRERGRGEKLYPSRHLLEKQKPQYVSLAVFTVKHEEKKIDSPYKEHATFPKTCTQIFPNFVDFSWRALADPHYYNLTKKKSLPTYMALDFD